MLQLYRAAWRVFVANLPALLAVEALLLALFVLEELAGWPFGTVSLLVYVLVVYRLHRAVLREERVAAASGLRDWRAVGRFALVAAGYQLLLSGVGILAMFVPIRSPDDPIQSLVPLGLVATNLIVVAMVGTAAPAAADCAAAPRSPGMGQATGPVGGFSWA